MSQRRVLVLPVLSLVAALLLGACGDNAPATNSSWKCSLDSDCDDGVFCNGAETCDPRRSRCLAGTPPSCGDDLECTIDLCDEATRQCAHVPDNSRCGAAQQCVPDSGCVVGGACTGDLDCDDGRFCNGAETCDLAAGICVPGAPPSCDDAIACTVDVCDEATGQCLRVADGSQCAAGEVCIPAPAAARWPECAADADCDDGVFCNGAETCDTDAGPAWSGPRRAATTRSTCTVDVCDEATALCHHVAVDSACNAGEFCSTTLGCQDVCVAASCDAACQGAGFPSGACHDLQCICAAPTCDATACNTACTTAGGYASGTCSGRHVRVRAGAATPPPAAPPAGRRATRREPAAATTASARRPACATTPPARRRAPRAASTRPALARAAPRRVRVRAAAALPRHCVYAGYGSGYYTASGACVCDTPTLMVTNLE